MLILSRKLNESIRFIFNEATLTQLLEQARNNPDVPPEVSLTIVRCSASTVRLGCDAPRCVRIIRDELPLNEQQSQVETNE